MADARWRDGCKAMLTVTGIFAGLSGVLLVTYWNKTATHADDWRLYVGATAILFSLYWFVRIAEMHADALDEEAPGTYVRAMYWFNLAVLGVFAAIAAYLSMLALPSPWPVLSNDVPLVAPNNIAAIAVLVAAFVHGPWFRDAYFLCERRAIGKGVNQDHQLVEIPNDEEWNHWIGKLLGKGYTGRAIPPCRQRMLLK